MTDNTQELDEILDRIISQESSRDGGWAEFILDEKEYKESLPYGNPMEKQNELKQAILDWHNKQIEELIKKPHILPKNAQHMESLKQGINFYHRQMRKRVDKLKEVK